MSERRVVTITDMNGTREVVLPPAPLPCFHCGSELTNQTTEKVKNWPDDACTFTTHGHYGSTVFDEIDGSKLEINICDQCLKKHRTRIGYWPGLPKRELKPWEGE